MFPLPCSMPSPYTPCQIPQSGPLHASPSMLAMSSVHVEPAWNSLCAQEASTTTTVMLRNIPNNYTRDQLLDRLSHDFAGTFDFLYMPMDFKNHCNMGYAFINFKDTFSCHRFAAFFHGIETSICLPGFTSGKVCHVTPARVQGLEANMQRLRQSSVSQQLAEHPEWHPLVFNERGASWAFLACDRKKLPSQPSVPELSVAASSVPDVCADAYEFCQIESQPASGGKCLDARKKKNSQCSTTVMLRNIPNNYTRSMLLQKLNRSFRGSFDFLYLPMDFESSCNMGYAFLNFRTVDECERFTAEFDGVECRVCLPGFSSAKVCRVTHARVQGLEGNIRHLRSSTIMRDLAKYPEWQPLVFTPNGDPQPLPRQSARVAGHWKS